MKILSHWGACEKTKVAKIQALQKEKEEMKMRLKTEEKNCFLKSALIGRQDGF